MKKLALLVLAGALLAGQPARADFFKDLGDALNDLGNSIGNAVDDAFTRKPDANKPEAAPAPEPEIFVAPVQTTGFSGALVYTPPASIRPRELPARRRAAARPGQPLPESVMFTTPSGTTTDDAPPPRRAPRRDPVITSQIAPLPGYAEAPSRLNTAYSPSAAALNLAAPSAASRTQPAPAPAPAPTSAPAPVASPAPAQAQASLPEITLTVQPAAPQLRSFILTFGNRRARISDQLLGAQTAVPPGESHAVVEAVAAVLKRDTTARLKLHSQALAPDDKLAEARRRSFDRARLVKSWLEDAGVRGTQIDMDVSGAGSADQITLTVYQH